MPARKKSANPKSAPARRPARAQSSNAPVKPRKSTKAPAKTGAPKARNAGKKAPAPAAKPSAHKPVKPPRMPSGNGDLPVQAYVTSLPGWQREVARRFEAVVAREVPQVQRAMRANVALYSGPKGVFASVRGMARHVKVTFHTAKPLKPAPPSDAITMAATDHFNEERMSAWVRQAAANPA